MDGEEKVGTEQRKERLRMYTIEEEKGKRRGDEREKGIMGCTIPDEGGRRHRAEGRVAFGSSSRCSRALRGRYGC
jgi:hypothetical protein